ncbi:MAG: DUF4446 family protein [Firmicutes bacterium]|nr:DUF4446 family protein [Bacillota bacterium]
MNLGVVWIHWIHQHADEVLLCLTVAVVALLALLALALGKMASLSRRSRSLFALLDQIGGQEGLSEVADLATQVAKTASRVDTLDERLDALQPLITSAARANCIRYEAFDHPSGQQSFSVAVLDMNGNGFVMSGLNNQAGTRVFAKPLKGGVSQYPLSPEELSVVESATQQAGLKKARPRTRRKASAPQNEQAPASNPTA